MQLAPLHSHPSVLWWSFFCQPILEPSICLSTAILPLSVLLAPFLPLHYPRPSPKTAGCTLQTPFPVNFTSILLPLRTPWPFTHPAIDNGVHFFCEQLSTSPSGFPIIIIVRKALTVSKERNILQRLVAEVKFLRCNALWSGRNQWTFRPAESKFIRIFTTLHLKRR